MALSHVNPHITITFIRLVQRNLFVFLSADCVRKPDSYCPWMSLSVTFSLRIACVTHEARIFHWRQKKQWSFHRDCWMLFIFCFRCLAINIRAIASFAFNKLHWYRNEMALQSILRTVCNSMYSLNCAVFSHCFTNQMYFILCHIQMRTTQDLFNLHEILLFSPYFTSAFRP